MTIFTDGYIPSIQAEKNIMSMPESQLSGISEPPSRPALKVLEGGRSASAPSQDIILPILPPNPSLPNVIEATRFDALSPVWQQRASLKRTILEASGAEVVGLKVVHERGRESAFDVFIAGNRTDIVGGRIHEVRDNTGGLIRTETVIRESH